MIDERPSCGSCPVCRGALDLAAVQVRDVWYCSASCAEGRGRAERRPPVVPEPWLYARPRRFFRKRRPKELNTSFPPEAQAAGSSGASDSSDSPGSSSHPVEGP